jgi:cell division protein FtsW (lipid II flippase)
VAVTYTTAAQRDAARTRVVAAAFDRWTIALVAASIFAGLLSWTAFSRAARTRVIDVYTGPVVNLNAVADASELEPLGARVLPSAADRRLAARAVLSTLAQAGGERRTIADVRTIGRARVEAAAIDRTPLADGYRTRLAEARARAKASGGAAPQSIPALTPAELTDLKPSLIVRTRRDAGRALLLWLALYVAAFHLVSLAWRIRGVKGDRMLLAAAHVLTALGLAAMISRPDPMRDAILFTRYAQGVIAGLLVCGAVSLVNLRTAVVRHLSYVPLLAAFVLSLALILFGGGPGTSNAKVNLGPFQPIEAIRILLALFLAGYFARNWELLRAVRADALGTVAVPRWLHLPRPRYIAPLLVGVAVALVLFFFQKDLGPALMLSVVFLAAYSVARGRVGLAMLGAVLLAAGFYAGYRLGISSTLAERVRMWQSPWDNAARGGSQIAHALWAMSTGGLFGTGGGLGDTRYIPAGYTDLVLASLGEEFGLIGLVAVFVLYAAIVARALRIAWCASGDYGFFLAVVIALSIAVPVLLMASGSMGLVPLTGVVTPFLSYGGSAMLANFAALGLLASIRSDTHAPADLAVFRASIRWLGGALGAAALAVVVVAARIQVLQADALAVHPHLGVQADGFRRYQENPRILDLVRRIPRGTIVDRNGLALATDDRDVVTKAAPLYARAGVQIEASCGHAGERCYPLGGRTFHLLGDARSRRNWSATNTSFVERDEEARLRGFDDHAEVVTVAEPDGSSGPALRRDYRDLLPLLRHRYDPDDPAVKRAMDTHRQLALTIDARLQARVAAILGEYARKSATGRAAAVVIDPATGDLLASVSYPWPTAGPAFGASDADADADVLLDRPRYGLYPPGSTFKLVTAAAALSRDAGAASRTFTCSRLPDNRVGAKVSGYARPVRDDEMDRTPHGTIDLHRALVVSCNAYFAQLAVTLGPQALARAAQPTEILLARNNVPSRIRDTLPQVGYGQGEVVTSPIRMARLVGALAADGSIRETRIVSSAPLPPAHPFVAPETAGTLARYMRDVVLDGTGRALRGHAVAIAGKTGTAEISGKPSHSWFVGFAPYGPAARRVVVAVILEHAGYGGAGAAPAAGEIVTAAAALGLAR